MIVSRRRWHCTMRDVSFTSSIGHYKKAFKFQWKCHHCIEQTFWLGEVGENKLVAKTMVYWLMNQHVKRKWDYLSILNDFLSIKNSLIFIPASSHWSHIPSLSSPQHLGPDPQRSPQVLPLASWSREERGSLLTFAGSLLLSVRFNMAQTTGHFWER